MEGTEFAAIRPLRSLGFQISLLVASAILIFGMVSSIFVINRQDRMYRGEKLRQWEILQDSMIPNMMNLIASNNLDGIRQILNKLSAENDEVHHIVLVNENSEIIYSTMSERDGKVTAKENNLWSQPVMIDPSTKVQVVQFRNEVKSGSSLLGKLYMGFNFLPSLEKERMTSILTLERAVQGAVKQYLQELDYYQVNFIASSMIHNVRDVKYFKVISADGMVVSSSQPKEILQPAVNRADLKILSQINARKPVWTRRLRRNGAPTLEVTLGTFNGEQTLGVLQVGYDMSSLNADLRRGKILFALLTAFSVFLAVAVAINIASRISRPVTHLTGVSREVGKGNLEVRAEVATGGDEMRLLGESFNRMIKGLRERNMIKDTFSRYVSRQVADELLKNPDSLSLGGKYREVTILFSDIRGFTTLSESMPAEKVVELLNEYFNVMVDAVFEFEGTLDKYIGDALMAVYGSPSTHEDDPLRAVKTALRMRRKLAELNGKWKSEGLPPINIGIGINTGNVIAGNIGHMQRMEYTVIGDDVNLASRIEGLTKEYNCAVMLSESTWEKIKDVAIAKKLGSVPVKGKAQPVEVYELIDLKEPLT